jgi:glycosyltransferase involved in cell wall biosynthesis
MMKVALVYDRVNKWGGAERVLLALHELFPEAPLYTSVYNSATAPWAKIFPKVIPSFLQKVPYASDRHEHFPFLMPLAFETFEFSEYDLVISVTSEAAKGVITKPGTVHICYCLTPIRYLWSHYDFYFKNPPDSFKVYPLFKLISKPFVWYMRKWDLIAAQRPDIYIAISNAVQARIKKYYDRDSYIIYSPTDIEKFELKKGEKVKKDNFYLYVSRLIPYKRADLAIEAFNELKLPLVIIGTGSEEKRFKAIAGENIKFVGELTDVQLAGYYQKARALIFPQEEDFGLVPIEAQAAGTPVIAYKAGGALDTVIAGKTGVFFEKQDKNSIIFAVKKFEKIEFDENNLIDNAKKFSKEIFKREFLLLIDQFIKNK